MSAVERFLSSMIVDLEKWRDGIGYDLEAIAEASGNDREKIQAAVIRHEPRGWQDIEAMAALDTPVSRQAIRSSRDSRDAEVRAAVLRFGKALLSEDERTELLVEGLETAEFYGGLTQFLAHAETWHPAPVIDALFRGASHREGEIAVHFAAMLMYLHGKADEAFDWAHRPFFLRFHTEDPAEREAAFRELCERVGQDPRRGDPLR
jgi:hypothetical protein